MLLLLEDPKNEKDFLMIKKMLLYFLCLSLFLSIPCCKKKLPTSPDIPDIDGLPMIEYFGAEPESIPRGESSTLRWGVTNAMGVAIDQGIGTVSVEGTIEVSPEDTTIYTLTASNSKGEVSQELTITVTHEAYIRFVEDSLQYTFELVETQQLPYVLFCWNAVIENTGNRTGKIDRIVVDIIPPYGCGYGDGIAIYFYPAEQEWLAGEQRYYEFVRSFPEYLWVWMQLQSKTVWFYIDFHTL